MWWVLTLFLASGTPIPASARMAMAAAYWWCVRAEPSWSVTDELTVAVRVPEGRWLWLVSRRLVSVLHPSYH